MHSINVKLASSKGHTMAGTIDMPDGEPRAYAMFAHCFTGSRFTPAASRVCKTLAEHGIAALRFDFPGLGQSTGEFGDTCFSENVNDILAAASWLEENYEAPQLLIGHSLGGAAALKAAGQIRSLKAVSTIGAPFDPAHSVLHYADRIKDVDEQGAVTVILGGREITISRSFLEDLADTDVASYLPRLRKPLLLLHSPIDTTVGVDNAQKIFQLTRYPKSLVALDKADHLCTRQGTAQRAGHLIAEWVEPYLEDHSTTPVLDEHEVEVRSIKGSKFGDLARSEHGEITLDRDKSDGGKGQGHCTMELIYTALAADTSQAIRKAAKTERLKVDAVQVNVVPRSDDVGSVTRHIRIEGELSDAQRARLITGLDTPVARLLRGLEITDKLH